MHSAPSLLTYGSHQLRVVDLEGNPWFVAADVFRILYGRTNGLGHVVAILGQDERTLVGRTTLGLPPGRDMALLSESGLYKLIMRSDKDRAKPFQDWVTREVLPAIRKDGAYIMGEEKVRTGGPVGQGRLGGHLVPIHPIVTESRRGPPERR